MKKMVLSGVSLVVLALVGVLLVVMGLRLGIPATVTPAPTTKPVTTPVNATSTTPTPTATPTPKPTATLIPPTPTTSHILTCDDNTGICFYPGEANGGPCYGKNGDTAPSPPWFYSAAQGKCINTDAGAPTPPPLICNNYNQACYYQGSVTGDYCFDKNGKYLPGWVYSVGNNACVYDGANP